MTVSIPVSRLTYKMIIYHHTPDAKGVIHVTNRDFLSDLLSHRWSEKLARVERMHQVCNLMIDISVSKDLYSKIKDYTYECGLHLHRYYRSMMLHYIWAQYQADLPAIEAIRNFYDEYDIDDNDYDTESCYRSWLRYKKEMESKSGIVLKSSRINQYKSTIATQEQMDMLLSVIVTKHLGLFFSAATETWIDSIFRHVSTVLHFFHSGLSKKDYVEKYDLNIRHFNRMLEKWNMMVNQTPELLITYRKACDTVGLSLRHDTVGKHSNAVRRDR